MAQIPGSGSSKIINSGRHCGGVASDDGAAVYTAWELAKWRTAIKSKPGRKISQAIYHHRVKSVTKSRSQAGVNWNNGSEESFIPGVAGVGEWQVFGSVGVNARTLWEIGRIRSANLGVYRKA